jgi:hypothetical protein
MCVQDIVAVDAAVKHLVDIYVRANTVQPDENNDLLRDAKQYQYQLEHGSSTSQEHKFWQQASQVGARSHLCTCARVCSCPCDN